MFGFFIVGIVVSVVQIVTIQATTANPNVLQFTYTGTSANFTVPTGVTFMTVDVIGARGGNAINPSNMIYSVNGGGGGRVQAILNVTAGMKFTVEVGGKPDSGDAMCGKFTGCPGGYGGGGGTNNYFSSAGGGGSYITDVTTNELIIAAGGGGGGCTSYSSQFCPLSQQDIFATRGGDGGGLEGETVYDYCVGTGGNQTHGGHAGEFIALNPNLASYSGMASGSFKKGGYGNYGGGGGGGYYGGGAGLYYSGGGGGSSYVTPSTTYNANRVVHTQGYNDQHGYINIVFNQYVYLDVTPPPSAEPTFTPSSRPFTVPTRRPTTGVTAGPSAPPTRRPTRSPVTSSPTFPITVPVIAPTPLPSVSDDDYTVCSRDNLKYFTGDEHDRCADELFNGLYDMVQSLSANLNLVTDILRQNINATQECFIQTNHNSQSLTQLTTIVEGYLHDVKFKEPTVPPTPVPTRRRRSRRPTPE